MTTLRAPTISARQSTGIPAGGWADRRAARRFWALSIIGIVVMIVSWCVFGLAYEEEMTEQPKALSVGTTMAGLGFLLGGVPLIIAHVAGFVILAVIAVRGRARTWTGLAYAGLAVALASSVGLVFAQVLWAGRLFLMGVNAPGLVTTAP